MKTKKNQPDWQHLQKIFLNNGGDKIEWSRFQARRKFLFGSVSTIVGSTLISPTHLSHLFSKGLMPAAWGAEPQADWKSEKPNMMIHNERPINGEFAPHLLNDEITPTSRHFVRNNGLIPKNVDKYNLAENQLTIDGHVEKKLTFSVEQLKKMPYITRSVVLECGGNGRALFQPAVRGNPWQRGAVACAEWTGVPLKNLLELAGIKTGAVYTAHFGDDPSIASTPGFSRGIPIEKAMDGHVMVAYAMNGKSIPPLHGFPLRLVVPGWIGSCSQKWLNKITILTKTHDSAKMSGYAYRVPAIPVAPGSRPPEEEMVIATSFPIKSLITAPKPMLKISTKQEIEISGHAWAGEESVKEVFLTPDFGQSWIKASLNPPRNKYAWSSFKAKMTFEKPGYHEVWSRAFDSKGKGQPFRQPWNPKGYLGNVIHRLPLMIT